MAVIELTHGGVITRGNGSMDVFVSYRDTPKGKDQPLHLAVKDPNSGIKESGGIIDTMPSSKMHNSKQWVKRRVDFPDGSFVRFTLRKTGGNAHGLASFRQSLHNFIVSPRESAALQELKINLPNDDKTNTSAIYVIGRFDFMLPSDIAKRGLNVGEGGNNDMASYDLAALDELIELRILEKGTRPRMQVRTLRNKKSGVAVARLRRTRRINLPT